MKLKEALMGAPSLAAMRGALDEIARLEHALRRCGEAAQRAAPLLREAAEELRTCVCIDGEPDWSHEPDAKAAFDTYNAAAERLEEIYS